MARRVVEDEVDALDRVRDLVHVLHGLVHVRRRRQERVLVDRRGARDAFRRERRRRHLTRLRDVIDDRLAVDRERHRLALVRRR